MKPKWNSMSKMDYFPFRRTVSLWNNSLLNPVRSEVPSAVTVKISIYPDMTPCSFVTWYQRFGETCCIEE